MNDAEKQEKKCGGDACKQCQGSECKEKFSKSTVLPEVTEVQFPSAQILGEPPGCAAGNMACSKIASPSAGVSYTIEVEPYCDSSGAWRFKVVKLEHKMALATVNNAAGRDGLLTDTVINRYNTCTDLERLRSTVVAIATATAGGQGTYYSGYAYYNPVGVLAHEELHLLRAQSALRSEGVSAVKAVIDTLELPIAQYPSLDEARYAANASEAVKITAWKAYDQLANAAARAEFDHPNPKDYDDRELAKMQPWLNKIDARKSSLGCLQ